MDLKGKIEELAARNLGKNELFLVETHISANPGMRKITVLVDGDKGVTVEDCVLISRKLGEAIELENLIDSPYLLEVSSPGVDFPLQSKRQYQKNIGRRVTVTLNDQEVKVGKLEEIKENGIVILEEQKEGGKEKKRKLMIKEIRFSDIKKCNVLIAF
ncbi:MAG: ribosome maturation factor RimP [Cytophagaceae bacterium]|nr:ribosome maturation factor RimP [Cytophagaceae bacterium]